MNTPYATDVFLSYCSADHAWAQHVHGLLGSAGISLFYDQSSLRAGDDWEDRILEALKTCRHLVVLWSNAAGQSPWVMREIGQFDALINLSQNDPSGDRRIMFVVLEGDNRAYSRYQMIYDLRDTGLYAPGADPVQINPNLWQAVVSELVLAIQDDGANKPISLAVLTMNRQQLEQIDATTTPPIGESLETVLNRLGIGTVENLFPFYGNTRSDWRPFGSPGSIDTILNQLLNRINAMSGGPRYRWALVSEMFWSGDHAEVKREADKLAKHPAVIVIDPLAFYVRDVKWRFDNYLWNTLENKDALVMVLAPFPLSGSHGQLRALIDTMANRVFDTFYNRSVEMGVHIAHCSTNIGDEMDILRWLLRVFGHRADRVVPETNQYLRV